MALTGPSNNRRDANTTQRDLSEGRTAAFARDTTLKSRQLLSKLSDTINSQQNITTDAVRSTSYLSDSHSLDQHLLLLLQFLDNLDGNLENRGDDIGRSERQPLCERDIGHSVTLVEFDPG